MKHSEHGTCPSSTGAAPGSAVVGFIRPDGRVAPIPTPIPVTPAMRVGLGPQPERMFRFAAACIGGGCGQWKDGVCGLIGRLQADLATEPPGTVVRCGIRPTCVWFRDSGLAACRVCPSVTYNPAP